MNPSLSLPASGGALLAATPLPAQPAAGDVLLRDAPDMAPFLQALQRTAAPALWARDADGIDAGPPPEPLPTPEPASTLDLLAALAPDSRPRSKDGEDPAHEDAAPAAAVTAPGTPQLVPADATQAFQPHGPALLATTAVLGPEPPPLAPTVQTPTAAPVAQAPVAAPAPPLPAPPVAARSAGAAPDAALPAPSPDVDPAPKPGPASPTATAPVPEKALTATAAALRETPAPAAWAAPLPADTQPTPVQHTGAASRSDGTPPSALLDALGERIGWQLQRGHERALIRLDPPLQGQLEIAVRRDGAGIQVQLTATHGDVVRQLHAISDSLRAELAGRQSGDVTITVAHTPREHDGRGRQQTRDHAPEPETPGQALAEADSGHAPAGFALPSFTS